MAKIIRRAIDEFITPPPPGKGPDPGKVVNLRPNFSGSNGYLFVSPCPPECNFRNETKIEPDLRLGGGELGSLVVPMILAIVTSRTENRATSRGTQRQFSENICSEDDLRSRIFGTFVVKFFACMPLLGFSNI